MSENSADELVQCIAAIERDGPARAGELFPLLYRELHQLAQRQLRRNPGLDGRQS